ncbi:hypothetical protein [Paenibacillus elgii]|uniref:hypothetical protein n=1 Tax=Paenibacillus elgii TaxID=189691 RepID=UPI0013D47366|nr:hypothetical protein [Paenibacillus elgii]
MYDFQTGDSIDESYVIVPEYPIQTLAVKREEVVRQAGFGTFAPRYSLTDAVDAAVRDLIRRNGNRF